MTVGSYQRRSDVMWPSDATEIRRAEETDHPRRATTEPPLPFYVQPAAGEALISWLGRLAHRFDLSPHQFAWQAFGVDNRGPAQWWLRPSPLSLKRISEVTGVPVDQLERMTLNNWSPSYRGDEADGGFSEIRYRNPPPQRWTRYVAVCTACLREDVIPYLRLAWFIGWVAVCPRHEIALVSRCPSCNSKLRSAAYGSASPRPPHQCATCGSSVLTAKTCHAHASVMKLDAALLRGKRLGAIDLAGLGRLSWPDTVALADVLMGTFWTALHTRERRDIYQRMVRNRRTEDERGSRAYGDRYHGLDLLAWLLEGWPWSTGSQVAISLLFRWSRARRSRTSGSVLLTRSERWEAGHEFDANSQSCLRTLLTRAMLPAR
jgi:hypothetical protein